MESRSHKLATRLVGEDPRDAYSGKPPQSLVSI